MHHHRSHRQMHFQGRSLTISLLQGVSDDLMNCFSSLLALSIPSEASAAQQRSYVTYTLSSLPLIEDETPSITLSESRSLLAAAGTTGLRTWEAALFLGDYLCSNKGIVRGKSIIELGAGTGYISILCAKQLGASHVLATDGSDDVVNGLSTNFSLNDLHDTSVVEGKELRWGDALVGSGHPAWIDEQKVDLVLGADVTYDGSGILALLSTFGDLLELFSDLKILISATIRNQATTNKFLNTCEVAGYRLEKIAFRMKTSHEQTGPFYTDKVPIELYQITKS